MTTAYELKHLRRREQDSAIHSMVKQLHSTIHDEKVHFSDATIACGGKFYQVHRMILSTSSKYFSDIFTSMEYSEKHPIVVLDNMSSSVFDHILKFIYVGEIIAPKFMEDPIRKGMAYLGLILPGPDNINQLLTEESAVSIKTEIPSEANIMQPELASQSRSSQYLPEKSNSGGMTLSQKKSSSDHSIITHRRDCDIVNSNYGQLYLDNKTIGDSASENAVSLSDSEYTKFAVLNTESCVRISTLSSDIHGNNLQEVYGDNCATQETVINNNNTACDVARHIDLPHKSLRNSIASRNIDLTHKSLGNSIASRNIDLMQKSLGNSIASHNIDLASKALGNSIASRNIDLTSKALGNNTVTTTIPPITTVKNNTPFYVDCGAENIFHHDTVIIHIDKPVSEQLITSVKTKSNKRPRWSSFLSKDAKKITQSTGDDGIQSKPNTICTTPDFDDFMDRNSNNQAIYANNSTQTDDTFIEVSLLKMEGLDANDISIEVKPESTSMSAMLQTDDAKNDSHKNTDKKQCPLCGKQVRHISRHLKSRKHNWSLADSKRASSVLGLSNKKSAKAKYRDCPVRGCLAKIINVSQHVRKIHGGKDPRSGSYGI